MSDKTTEWEPTGLERFGHLEDKIFRVVEAFKAIRKENEIIIICKYDSSVSLLRQIGLGERAPLYATASGKAILACHRRTYCGLTGQKIP